jgi:hypothetical protein
MVVIKLTIPMTKDKQNKHRKIIKGKKKYRSKIIMKPVTKINNDNGEKKVR